MYRYWYCVEPFGGLTYCLRERERAIVFGGVWSTGKCFECRSHDWILRGHRNRSDP